MILCRYCGAPRKDARGWHDCPAAQRAKTRLSASLCAIDELMRGGTELSDDPERLNKLDDMRQSIRLAGRGVK